MPISNRAALLTATAVAGLALVTACGSSGSSGSAGTATSPAAPAGPSSPATSGGTPELQTTGSASLGTIVTDGNGMTLYRFDHDTAKPSASHCDGSCATLWPPVKAVTNAQVKGIDSKLVGTVTRSDGTQQVTLNGWPLYRYTPDTKPGDTKGQGFGGIWFVSDPTGGKAMAVSSTPSPSTGGGGSGY